ncbi:LamG-like jellyroll fold domain-containing protein [Segetibacter koreensis]|uniref:LamG-like jellyroll fold domain-containing protein n=1 Tax=Segetibacter koreensis TaxID=398037 RepID=UPI00037D0B2E|nr:LamG-like jellyroll fold domain-containing protein [Segetibacter koreensis]
MLAVTMKACKKDCGFTSSSHLVAYYPFTGNALDATQYHNDGQVNNTVLTTDKFGRKSHAYYFNGENSFIFIPKSSSLDIKESFTISAWVRPDLIQEYTYADRIIVWRGDEQPERDPYVLYFSSNSIAVRKDVGTGGTTNISSYASNSTLSEKWFNVIGTYDITSNTAKLFIDGTLVKQDSFQSGEIQYSTEGFWNMIGAVDKGTWQFYKG